MYDKYNPQKKSLSTLQGFWHFPKLRDSSHFPPLNEAFWGFAFGGPISLDGLLSLASLKLSTVLEPHNVSLFWKENPGCKMKWILDKEWGNPGTPTNTKNT